MAANDNRQSVHSFLHERHEMNMQLIEDLCTLPNVDIGKVLDAKWFYIKAYEEILEGIRGMPVIVP